MTTRPDETPASDPDAPVDEDVVVGGGGAAGLSAAVFLARYGLETLVFARGKSAIRQCAYLENYLGFPGGMSPERFLALGRAHVEDEGGRVVEDRVERVERIERVEHSASTGPAVDDGDGDRDGNGHGDRDGNGDGAEDGGWFRIQTQEGRSVVSRYVLAASAYDADYLADFEDALETDEDPGFLVTEGGRTPVDGLYAAGWLTSDTVHQAVVNAGGGARAALALARDDMSERYWPAVGERYVDWVVDDGRYGGEGWDDHVDGWFEREMLPDDADLPSGDEEGLASGDEEGLDPALVERAREDLAAEFLDRCIDEDERRRREREGQRRLLDHLDDDLIDEYARTETGERREATGAE